MSQDLRASLSNTGTGNHKQNLTELMIRGIVDSLELKVGDHKAHYLKAGSGDPVTLVHGGASDSRDWLGTMSALSHSYTLYAPDLIGYGQSSDNNSGYYLSDFVDFTLGLTQKLGLDSQVLVGHSLGGRVCLEIALRHPEKVRRLVLIDTAGFSRLTRLGFFLATAFWGMRKIFKLPQPYPRLLHKESEDRDWLCLDKLPNLKVPTLIVWNRHDPYYPISGALRAKELIPESQLEIIPGYGHAPHVKKNATFNSILESFTKHG